MLPRLVVITDLAVASPARIVEVARAVVASAPKGSCAFALRDHAAPVRLRVELGATLRDITRRGGALLFVHDRADVARRIEADGVHLGRRSISVRDARAFLGASAIVGVSCHDEGEMASAIGAGADYVTLSPLFASPGKGEALGEARFAAMRGGFSEAYVVALGGVDATNAARARACGANGVAAIRAVLAADAPGEIARRMVEAMG